MLQCVALTALRCIVLRCAALQSAVCHALLLQVVPVVQFQHLPLLVLAKGD